MNIHLTKDHLVQILQKRGYSPLDYLFINEIQNILNQLNEQQFDQEYFQEIIDQCKTNSKAQIKVQDLIDNFIKAESILVQRDQQIKKKIIDTKLKIKEKNKKDQRQNIQILQLQEQIAELGQQQKVNEIGLSILRKPFMKNLGKSKRSFDKNYSSVIIQNQQQNNYQPLLSPKNQFFSKNTQTYSWMLELCSLLMVISLPCMLYHNTFMNILLFGLIILNFISGYFCKTILRKWMYLLIASVIIDIIWYLFGTQYLWNSDFRDWPHFINPYLRLAVVLTSVVSMGKLILIILLISQYNTDESQKKKVSFFGFIQFELSHDDKTKNLFWVLNRPSNRSNQQDYHS